MTLLCDVFQDQWGFTPLHEAASKNKVEVCISLLQNGADPSVRNSEGQTPLDVAVGDAALVLTGDYRKVCLPCSEIGRL